jgi:hypothetical protein
LPEGLVAVRAGGWFGKIEKNGRTGAIKVGIVNATAGGSAGVATNAVADYVRVVGVSRNPDAEFVTERCAPLPPKLLNASAQ